MRPQFEPFSLAWPLHVPRRSLSLFKRRVLWTGVAGSLMVVLGLLLASLSGPQAAWAMAPADAPNPLELSSLDGTNGFTINGIDAGDGAGRSVSIVGDVNGDGVDDMLIGAYQADPGDEAQAGESYVVFGQTSGFPASLNAADLNGTNGFVINGIDAGDEAGQAVSGAGDVNGDGVGDLIIGARAAGTTGQSYVVFGQAGGFPASLNLADLNGTNGFALNGIDVGDLSGTSVSDAGDVNGDGFDDVLIGAVFADPGGMDNAGESYVVFGHAGAFPASMNLADLDGTDGFVLNGAAANDESGEAVSGAGDVNDDGIADILIGAPGAFNGGTTGKSYVVFGHTGAFPASMNLADLDGTDGFVLNGIDANDQAGRAVSDAGDVNGDGVDDMIIGASSADQEPDDRAGESYIVFGQAGGFGVSVNLADLNGTNGFVFTGNSFDSAGFSVSEAGDMNRDGFDDVVIGAVGGGGTGKSYVLFGQANPFPASLGAGDLDGNNGFALNGVDSGDSAGYSVSGGGDVNGDTYDDVLIGAPGPVFNTDRPGEAYVVFGDDFADVPTAVTLDTLQSQPASGLAAGGWLAALFATLGLVWIRLRRR